MTNWGPKITVENRKRPSFLRDNDVITWGQTPSSPVKPESWLTWNSGDWNIVNPSFFLEVNHPYYTTYVKSCVKITQAEFDKICHNRSADWQVGARTIMDRYDLIAETLAEKLIREFDIPVDKQAAFIDALKQYKG